MKNIFFILLLLTLSINISSADDFDWVLNQTEFKNPNKLTFWDKTKRFQIFLEENTPDKKLPIEFGEDRYPIVDDLIGSLSHPEGSIKKLKNRYVVVESCMYKYCVYKGLVFIDTKKKSTINVLYLNEGGNGYQLISTKMFDSYNQLPKIFFDILKDWKKENQLDDYPLSLKFLGSDKIFKDIK